uniref:Uncharacterized protein n=1 Tax=Arundo donax TaxID=35708 RepID=A0A0A8YBL5_ARUDO
MTEGEGHLLLPFMYYY